MNRFRLTLTCGAIAASLILVSPAFAQAQKSQKRPGDREPHSMAVARISLAQIDSLVHLTPEQRAKISAIRDKFLSDSKALRPTPGTPPNPENRQKLRELSHQATQKIMAVLTPDQKQKLQQALREKRWMRGIAQINLTPEQKARLNAIRKEAREKIMALPPEERRTKGREIMK
ncbi:MAG TPA: hypothetical protein VNJ09_06715, partial [Chthonomonadales bacterium]|nr:hypothetical protein [Chthonomonadales bacterium]